MFSESTSLERHECLGTYFIPNLIGPLMDIYLILGTYFIPNFIKWILILIYLRIVMGVIPSIIFTTTHMGLKRGVLRSVIQSLGFCSRQFMGISDKSPSCRSPHQELLASCCLRIIEGSVIVLLGIQRVHNFDTFLWLVGGLVAIFYVPIYWE